MAKYAIIKIGPFQYTVEEGKEYSVPKFEAEEGKKFSDFSVLAVANDKDIKFGTPEVSGAKIGITVIEQGKGEKVTQMVYKSKSRYRRKRGHRKQVTKFKVDSIA